MKATSIKEAMRRWEEKHPSKDITKAKEIGLQFQFPPIEKMDNALSILHSCQKLNLSSNMIEKINGLGSMRNLKILSLGRNYIKSLTGLEGVADTLEELWISYNFIEKVKGITVLQKLKVLYMAHNLVKDWMEFNKLQDLPLLEELFFEGNPLHETLEDEEWRIEVTRRLLKLKILDGEKLEREN